MVIMPAMQVGSIDGIKGNQTSGWGREGNWCVIQEFSDLRDCRFKTSLPLHLPALWPFFFRLGLFIYFWFGV